MARRMLGATLQTVLVLALVGIVIGQLIGQPVLLAYVTSDSMEETISTGDGFVVLPAIVTDAPEQGDIIVFNAKTLNDNAAGVTTHRVVETTNEGLITKGDNNPFTDQEAGEPVVKHHQVIGEAVQIAGHPIVIPHLGTLFGTIRSSMADAQRAVAIALGTRSLLGTQGLAYILFGLGIVLYLGSVLFEDSGSHSRRRQRNRKRTRRTRVSNEMIAVGLAIVLVASVTAAMTLGGGIQTFDVVSAEHDAPGHSVIASGTTENMRYTVPNGGVIPMLVYLDPAGTGVSTPASGTYIAPGAEQTVSVSFSVPEKTGYYPRSIAEHRYLVVLPPSVIDLLYRVHPWLPVIVIDALVFGVFVALALGVLGRGYVRPRKSRNTLVRRIKRRFNH